MRGFYHNENNEVVITGNRKPSDPDGLTWVEGHEINWPEKLFPHGVYSKKWDGDQIIDNPEYLVAAPKAEEKKQIISDLKGALVWQFKMIREIFELGVSKNLWSGSDVDDTELKQEYAKWKTNLDRLDELG